MTITQTVDIPESHRLVIDVPREVPAGRTVITFTPPADMEPEMDETEYLMRSPANREQLLNVIKNVEEGKNIISFETMEQLDECVKERGSEKRGRLCCRKPENEGQNWQ
jgi:hypothetical protein